MNDPKKPTTKAGQDFQEEVLAQRYQDAANRLHHLSLRYTGAIHEVAQGKPVGLIARDHPGNREMRDFLDLGLLVRAEVNGITRLLVEKGILTAAEVTREFAEQYDWLAKEKAKFLGIEVFEGGIKFKGQQG